MWYSCNYMVPTGGGTREGNWVMGIFYTGLPEPPFLAGAEAVFLLRLLLLFYIFYFYGTQSMSISMTMTMTISMTMTMTTVCDCD